MKRFDHPKLNVLKPLASDDAEVDFFENIVHIQVSFVGRSNRREIRFMGPYTLLTSRNIKPQILVVQ